MYFNILLCSCLVASELSEHSTLTENTVLQMSETKSNVELGIQL